MENDIVYAGFWRRFGAYWLDLVCLLPLVAITLWLGGRYRLFHLYYLVPSIVVGLLFHVYLVFRFGGTPGKLILNTRIALLDGGRITFMSAVIRYSVLCVLSILSSLALVLATLRMTDEQYLSLGFLDRGQLMVSLAPPWYVAVHFLLNIWIWSEFVTMLFNKKRRAIHDFMACTVVIRTDRQLPSNYSIQRTAGAILD